MSHLVSYYWFRRTQYIPRFGGILQGSGGFTWRVSDCEELSGGLLTGDDVNDPTMVLVFEEVIDNIILVVIEPD